MSKYEDKFRKDYDLLDPQTVLTISTLTSAIQNSLESHKIHKDDAERMAEHILNFFGYSDRIIDNVLQPEDRDVFYMMEDTGILTTEREETTLYDGREWRINYWILKLDRIEELLGKKISRKSEEEPEDTVYMDLPDEAWHR